MFFFLSQVAAAPIDPAAAWGIAIAFSAAVLMSVPKLHKRYGGISAVAIGELGMEIA